MNHDAIAKSAEETTRAVDKLLAESRLTKLVLDADGTPVVTHKKPRCPRCRKLRARPQRSWRDGELSTALRKCKHCGQVWYTLTD